MNGRREIHTTTLRRNSMSYTSMTLMLNPQFQLKSFQFSVFANCVRVLHQCTCVHAFRRNTYFQAAWIGDSGRVLASRWASVSTHCACRDTKLAITTSFLLVQHVSVSWQNYTYRISSCLCLNARYLARNLSCALSTQMKVMSRNTGPIWRKKLY